MFTRSLLASALLTMAAAAGSLASAAPETDSPARTAGVAAHSTIESTSASPWQRLTMVIPAEPGDDHVDPRRRSTSFEVDGWRLRRQASPGPVDALDGLTVRRAEEPDRSVVHDEDGNVVATFTDGASTVAVEGQQRVFDEPTATHAVTTTTWVRMLPEPFDGEIDAAWLHEARADESPDVLETAMQYTDGSPDIFDEDGVLLAANAAYGPMKSDGRRAVGADWHDFQGITATYGDTDDEPKHKEFRSLDCSGYMRILFGVRFGLPVTLRPDGGDSLPRRSMEQASEAPGVTPIPNSGTKVSDHGSLQPGDLVFFDAPSDDDGVIDHVGLYVGEDDGGHLRFLHSRSSHNGPTIGGDAAAPSILDGTGFFAEGFRSSRRL